MQIFLQSSRNAALMAQKFNQCMHKLEATLFTFTVQLWHLVEVTLQTILMS